MIPCYVSGAGMFAGDTTRNFKTLVIEWLEETGIGYDTRYRYYRSQFPELALRQLARKVCDPVEYYDRDWPAWRAAHAAPDDEPALARFIVERDGSFRGEAQVAIYCFDEAGIGSGINVMRFIQHGKPVFGFYAAEPSRRKVNLTNVLQLAVEFPGQVLLASYRQPEDITVQLGVWLRALRQPGII